ncbi:MAG: hypothetical protein BWX84_01965 [Verrucomicrobia bacterium ADurb.Bin118]|nr:MAG: hypothetical protein BWX84_01965 [Verrucomicrobia bacterium ADurb.Bin118]
MGNRVSNGAVSNPLRVVAPIKVKRGRFNRTLRAFGPWSMMMSSLKSSIAGYRYSSMVFCRRWISSTNSTSPASRFVSSPARSAAFSMVGPLVQRMLAPIALARMKASVVLPSPGGPLSRMWSMDSWRWRAAATVISRRSLTLGWPVNSVNSDGRSVISNAASGLFRTSETIRSGMAIMMREAPAGDKAKAGRAAAPGPAAVR